MIVLQINKKTKLFKYLIKLKYKVKHRERE